MHYKEKRAIKSQMLKVVQGRDQDSLGLVVSKACLSRKVVRMKCIKFRKENTTQFLLNIRSRGIMRSEHTEFPQETRKELLRISAGEREE